jgi:Ca2+-binding RTX toxin-like protein
MASLFKTAMLPTATFNKSTAALFDNHVFEVVNSTGWIVDGTSGHDTLYGSQYDDAIYGYAGIDTLYGQGGNDQLFGGEGNDRLNGGAGADYLDGGTGTDSASYSGSASAVTINLATGKGYGGDAQDDTLASIENLFGSSYSDALIGDSNNNVLSGEAGHDFILGGAGQDTLLGGAGDDAMYGGTGRDFIESGSGNDRLYGDDVGTVAVDVFAFNASDSGTDRVMDFQRGVDVVLLKGFGLDAFGRDGKLAMGFFGPDGKYFGYSNGQQWYGEHAPEGGDKVMFLTDTRQLVKIESFQQIGDNYKIGVTVLATFNDIPKETDFVLGL